MWTSANITDAVRIIVNAKTRRVSICNALDVVLAQRYFVQNLTVAGYGAFKAKCRNTCGCEKLPNTETGWVRPSDTREKTDFDTEFLDYVLAVKVVGDFEEAMRHIEAHSLGHRRRLLLAQRNSRRFPPY